MNIYEAYSEIQENLRVVDTGKSKFKIVRQANGDGLWHIETDSGQLPVAFRDKRYTSHRVAYSDIKNYLDGASERAVLYRKEKKKDE